MSRQTKMTELSKKRVFVAGHRGMVGSAIVRALAHKNCVILTADRDKLDLSREDETHRWMLSARPDIVVLAAARVGGILANLSRPVDFLCENLAIELNVIRAAHAVNVEKLLFLGSSCIYPQLARQPIHESELLQGPLEPTNQWYAIAKIAGIKMCQAFRQQHGSDFISAMPTNLYGTGDNYNPEESHVPAALMKRFHDAKRDASDTVTVWGTGKPLREFLYVDDLADACCFLLMHYSDDAPINVGSGQEISIADFALLIAEVVGFKGRIVFDRNRPDGTPRKLLDRSRLTALGWNARTRLVDGLAIAYRDFLTRYDDIAVD